MLEGMMPETPGSDSDEPSPAGTASRSDQPLSPADVLYVSGMTAAFQNNEAESKHKKLCSEFAALHGDDFRSTNAGRALDSQAKCK
jgi:hypothetical protein